MAANDYGIYEFIYDNIKTDYLLSWKNYFGVGPDHSVKKRKLNNLHVSFFSFWGSEEDHLVDLVVDNVRNLLYAVSKLGKINVFYLNPSNKKESLVVSCDLFEEVRKVRVDVSVYLFTTGTILRDYHHQSSAGALDWREMRQKESSSSPQKNRPKSML